VGDATGVSGEARRCYQIRTRRGMRTLRTVRLRRGGRSGHGKGCSQTTRRSWRKATTLVLSRGYGCCLVSFSVLYASCMDRRIHVISIQMIEGGCSWPSSPPVFHLPITIIHEPRTSPFTTKRPYSTRPTDPHSPNDSSSAPVTSIIPAGWPQWQIETNERETPPSYLKRNHL
jgi:hypothetical protein